MSKVLVLSLVLMCIWSVAVNAQEDTIIGCWEWIGTEYLCCLPETPLSEGYEEQLFFGEDHLFLRYRNQVVTRMASWSIETHQEGDLTIKEIVTSAGDHWYWAYMVGEPRGLILTDEPIRFDGGANKAERFVERGPVANEATAWGSVKSLFR